MNSPEAIEEMRASGCPVRAAELLLDGAHPRVRSRLASLARREWCLPLPPESPWIDVLRRRIGREPDVQHPQPGVYALSVVQVEGESLGLVERVVPSDVDVRGFGEFSAGTECGEWRARNWLTRRIGPVEALSRTFFSLERVAPLTAGDRSFERRGESAGLAAALATVWRWRPDRDAGGYVAATGRVDGDGTVHPVDGLETKLAGLEREAPYIRTVLVPCDSGYDEPTVRRTLRIVPVRTVDEALEHVFGGIDMRLALLPPLEAAREALSRELAREHSLAENYAAAAASRIDELDGCERSLVEALSTAVTAISETHRGAAKQAAARFAEIESIIWPGGRPSRDLRVNLVAQLTSMQASALIDTLDPARAVAACERCEAFLENLEALPELALRGSWTRALSASRRLDEAQAQARQQCAVRMVAGNRHQLAQANCNLIEVELHRHAARDEGALARARTALDVGYASNQDAGEAARRRNQLFLRYWEVRIMCLDGRIDEARRRADEMASGWYPAHLLPRFVAESLVCADRKDEALELLERTRLAISPHAAGFERMVLLSASALEAELRMERGERAFRDVVVEFVKGLEEWRPGFIEWPSDPADDRAWIGAVRDAVSRLPY